MRTIPFSRCERPLPPLLSSLWKELRASLVSHNFSLEDVEDALFFLET